MALASATCRPKNAEPMCVQAAQAGRRVAVHACTRGAPGALPHERYRGGVRHAADGSLVGRAERHIVVCTTTASSPGRVLAAVVPIATIGVFLPTGAAKAAGIQACRGWERTLHEVWRCCRARSTRQGMPPMPGAGTHMLLRCRCRSLVAAHVGADLVLCHLHARGAMHGLRRPSRPPTHRRRMPRFAALTPAICREGQFAPRAWRLPSAGSQSRQCLGGRPPPHARRATPGALLPS